MHSQKSAIKCVWRMEDVLEVYTRPYDECFPQVCLNEKSKQLVSEVRKPLGGGRPGRLARHRRLCPFMVVADH
ncbi:MAG: hypothetical protein AVDCRST_MAG28-3128 [uncultured Rubrobacteraceae bacterium]|uniref:Uncharacterized protein n=1 Tax=uncultured Rubrobacteraceae bacterium TaxID=349277 RepID=A0A6J4R0P3_9ACTN|nr:MAG: hypothetical protein AVDCRST_MAG28-3128 [uncultured Rubrobacteraceae bacterium]